MNRNKIKQQIAANEKRKTGSSQKSCYFCGRPATSREHVPARGFFPPDMRKDLITVPSCELHNHAKSNDDEYVRTLISLAGSNQATHDIIDGKVARSIKRNSKLIRTILEHSVPVTVRGEYTRAMPYDVQRVEQLIDAIARGLYYYEVKKIYRGDWSIFPYSPIASVGTKDPYGPVRKLALTFPFEERQVSNPDVFRFAFFSDVSGTAYRVIFYNSVVFFAIGPKS